MKNNIYTIKPLESELKIEATSGYEIDIEESDLKLGKICFKKIKQVDQQEFDTFFKGLLEGCKSIIFIGKDSKKTIIPTGNFTLCDCNGRWLFDVSTDGKRHFWYSYHRILPLFEEKFGVNYLQLRDLMQPVLNNVFNLYGVTPDLAWLPSEYKYS